MSDYSRMRSRPPLPLAGASAAPDSSALLSQRGLAEAWHDVICNIDVIRRRYEQAI
jgi:hypothetical protein